MSNPLIQTIEALAKEKGIEPDVVIGAIEDAGAHRLAQVLQDEREPEDAVQPGHRPGRPVRRQADRPRSDEPGHRDLARRSAAALRRGSRSGHGDRVSQAHRRARPHRRADRQAGDLPEGARGRAREHFCGIQRAHRRGGQRHGEALRERRHGRRARAHRGQPAPQGTVARRKLRARRAAPHRDQGRQSQRERPADRAVAHRSGAARQAVRAGSAGNLRRHRADSRRGARSRRPRQSGGVLARARRRPGGRVRRHEGHARAGHHPRAPRREDRHRRVVGRSRWSW